MALRPQISFLGIGPAICGARFSVMAEAVDVVFRTVVTLIMSAGTAFPDASCMFGRDGLRIGRRARPDGLSQMRIF